MKKIIAVIGFTAFFSGCTLPFSGDKTDTTMSMDMHDHAHNMDTVVTPVPPGTILTKAQLFARGEMIFEGVCSHCHQKDAKGLKDSIPPLLGSDFLMADRKRSISIVLNGLLGEIAVNGKTYNSFMPPISGADENVASVLTFVRNYYNGAADSIAPAEVMQQRMGM